MRLSLPLPLPLSIAILGILCGCEKPQPRSQVPDEPWSADVEKTVQDAEAMRYSVEQWKAEKKALQEMGYGDAAPRPPQR